MVSSKQATPTAYLASLPAEQLCAVPDECVSGDKVLMDTLVAAYKAARKKLDMGKSRLRFKAIEDLPLDVIGDIVASTSVEHRIEAAEAARQKKR